ncbi:hypothetical protein Zmor_023949 [Zophobas morio]|uniref:Carboxylic ester hydrolase n=1 Tax=Zophobas morio TaxID=2755281 RepID=A0AA38M7Y6_9CUCU|nr:hypothetical protein Zmor_023949 [Zophobas morio]
MWLRVFLIVFVLLHCVFAAQNVQVSTPLGKILGTTLTTRLGKTIYAFRGIRYGKPPVNELRFKPPQPVDPWSGIYNATSDAPACPQPGITPVSEDCLFLNVYATKLPAGKNNPKRPVIIHLHPGGFYSVTSRSNWAGPQYFMDQDIVMVTLNYRLATLGFISVGKEAPGNNGLRDQVIAMKWVQKNIASFGGDPNSVTLYGYSAGAWSITLHMVSPMSRGLFHKAILGSGSALGHWPLPRHQLDLAKKQARIVGCPDDNATVVIDCLRKTPAEELGNSFFQFAEFGTDPILIWSPVIEEDFGQERFLPDHPIKLIKSGKFEQVPVIAGITKDEFAQRAFPILSNDSLLQQVNNDFERYAPLMFIYERGTSKSKEVSRSVRQFYLGVDPITNASLQNLENAYSDSIVGFPANRAVDLISTYSNKPVYYYLFTYQGRYSHFYLPDSNGTIPNGVAHHDDLIYLFYISPLFPFFNSSFPETKMVETLSSLWANFANTGDPTDCSLNENIGNIEWIPYDTTTKKYLEIGEKLTLKEKLFEDRYSFWRNLYPLSSNV